MTVWTEDMHLTDSVMAKVISDAINEHSLNIVVSILSEFDVSPGPQNGINLSQDQRRAIVDLIAIEDFTRMGR